VDFVHQYHGHVVPKKDKTPTQGAPASHVSVQNSILPQRMNGDGNAESPPIVIRSH
jgi:hypothetical protein